MCATFVPMNTDEPAALEGGTVVTAAPGPRRTRAKTGDLLRKPVNTLAIIPKSTRITMLGRKAYNVLLYEAQEQGLEHDVFRTPLERIIKGVAFDSNDYELVKKHLRAMVSTAVEWQSPTAGEGGSWNVSGLLAHAKLSKVRGQVWVEWSYGVNLKQELLEPTVFARLKLEILSQLRTHAAIALYEICTRYKEIGRTSRQRWRWWRPVLTGQPDSDKTAKLEYRIFKRDTLKMAVAEVSALTDIEVELVEHREGRFIEDIQFLVRPKRQASLPLTAPAPVDLTLVVKGRALGLPDEKVEDLVEEFGADSVRAGMELLERRIATSFPAPVRDPLKYLRSILTHDSQPTPSAVEVSNAVQEESPSKLQGKRQARWRDEWVRRRRERIIAELTDMAAEPMADLVAELLSDMELRNVHPSIRKRLREAGWTHPLAQQEMIRYYAAGAHGENWDQPTTEQLLQIASEMGDAP